MQKARRWPVVKFRDVDADMLERIKSSSRAARRQDAANDTDSDDEGTDDESSTRTQAHPANSRALLPDTAVNMSSPDASTLFRDMLSDKPLVAAPAASAEEVATAQAAEKKRKRDCEVDWSSL